MKGALIQGLGAALPGVEGVQELRAWFQAGGPEPVGRYGVKDKGLIPPMLRRRMSPLSTMAVMASLQAGGLAVREDGTLSVIFATSAGEINSTEAILASLHDDPPTVSPARFHCSVHNGAMGFLSIIAHNPFRTTTITMHSLSFEYALLEGLARLMMGEERVLITAGDEEATGFFALAPGSVDFCGSLLLARPQEHPEGALAILCLERHMVTAMREADELDRRLQARMGTRSIIVDRQGDSHPWGSPVIASRRNGSSGLFLLLQALLAPSLEGPVLVSKLSASGELFQTVIQRQP